MVSFFWSTLVCHHRYLYPRHPRVCPNRHSRFSPRPHPPRQVTRPQHHCFVCIVLKPSEHGVLCLPTTTERSNRQINSLTFVCSKGVLEPDMLQFNRDILRDEIKDRVCGLSVCFSTYVFAFINGLNVYANRRATGGHCLIFASSKKTTSLKVIHELSIRPPLKKCM